MSSSEEMQRFRLGLHVDASDGRCGKLTRVIIDPVAQSLTHLVITPPHHTELARLVSVDVVEAVERDTIRLRCTKQ